MCAYMLHGIIKLLHMMLIQLVLSEMMMLCTVHILIVIIIMCSAVRCVHWTCRLSELCMHVAYLLTSFVLLFLLQLWHFPHMIMYEAPLNLLLLFNYSNHHSAYLLPPYLPDAGVYAYPIVVSHAIVHNAYISSYFNITWQCIWVYMHILCFTNVVVVHTCCLVGFHIMLVRGHTLPCLLLDY